MSTITPDDSHIVYSPYNWAITGTGAAARAKSVTVGAYLRVMFSGSPTDLVATFDTTNVPTTGTADYISIVVDGQARTDVQLAASIPITLPADTWGSHTIDITIVRLNGGDRWAAPQAPAVVFKGLSSSATTITSRVTRKRARYGLAIGDSRGEGINSFSNLGNPNVDFDARLGWAFPLRDLLGCELGVVAHNGLMISQTNTQGNAVPKLPTMVPTLWSGQARDFTTNPPDFVVINLGINDSLNNSPAANVIADTTAACNEILAAAPRTRIFFVSGWEQAVAGSVQSGIAACTAPGRVTYVDTTGWWASADASDGLHPYGYINTHDLSPRLAAAIKAGMGNSYVNIGGNAVPVGL